MSPKEAKVFVIEDSPTNQTLVKAALNFGGHGHQVVGTATSKVEAREKIGKLKPGEVDVFVVDGNMSTVVVEEGRDGRELVADIKEHLGAKTVGFSGSGAKLGADVELGKPFSPQRLNEIITDL